MTLLITKDLQNPLANYITFRIKFEISNKIWENKNFYNFPEVSFLYLFERALVIPKFALEESTAK